MMPGEWKDDGSPQEDVFILSNSQEGHTSPLSAPTVLSFNIFTEEQPADPGIAASAPTPTGRHFIRKGRFEVSAFKSIGNQTPNSSSPGNSPPANVSIPSIAIQEANSSQAHVINIPSESVPVLIQSKSSSIAKLSPGNADNNNSKVRSESPAANTETTSQTTTSKDLNATLLDQLSFGILAPVNAGNILSQAANTTITLNVSNAKDTLVVNDPKILSHMLKMHSSDVHPDSKSVPLSDKDLLQAAHAITMISDTNTSGAMSLEDNNFGSKLYVNTLDLQTRVATNYQLNQERKFLDTEVNLTLASSPPLGVITDSTLSDVKSPHKAENVRAQNHNCTVFECLKPRVKMGYCGMHYKEFHVFEQYTDLTGRSLGNTTSAANPTNISTKKGTRLVPFARLRFEIAAFDKDLYIGERFGVCKYGDMFKGKLFGQEVSVKVLQKVDMIMDLDVEKFRKNVEKMKSLRHPNIVQFMDVSWSASMQSFCILEEYLPNGSLKDLLVEFANHHTKSLFSLQMNTSTANLDLKEDVELDDLDDDIKESQFNLSTDTNLSSDTLDDTGEEKVSPANVQRWTWKRYLCVAQDIVRGLSWLHHKFLTHNNLKPSNVLLTSENNVKISDFIPIISSSAALQSPVSSYDIHDKLRSKTLPVPLPSYFYEDPANATPLTSNESEFSFEIESKSSLSSNQRADIFTFGSILYEMLCFCHPKYFIVERKEMNLQIKEHAFTYDEWRPSIPGPPFCLPGVKSLIEKCWQKDPNKRPTVEYVMTQLMEMENDIDQDLRKALEDQIANWEVSEKVKDLLLVQLEQMKDMSNALKDTREQLNQAFVQLRNVKQEVDREEKAAKQAETELEDVNQTNMKYQRLLSQQKAEIARLKKEIGEEFLINERKLALTRSPYADMMSRANSLPLVNFDRKEPSSPPPSRRLSVQDSVGPSPRRTSTTSYEIEARMQKIQEESISRRGSLQEELINKFKTHGLVHYQSSRK